VVSPGGVFRHWGGGGGGRIVSRYEHLAHSNGTIDQEGAPPKDFNLIRTASTSHMLEFDTIQHNTKPDTRTGASVIGIISLARGRADNKKEGAVRLAAAKYLKSLADGIQGGRKFVRFQLPVLENSIPTQCGNFQFLSILGYKFFFGSGPPPRWRWARPATPSHQSASFPGADVPFLRLTPEVQGALQSSMISTLAATRSPHKEMCIYVI